MLLPVAVCLWTLCVFEGVPALRPAFSRLAVIHGTAVDALVFLSSSITE